MKRRVGYLPDSVGFYDGLTGRSNLAYTARLNRIARPVAAERIEGLLEQVGLGAVADRRVETYSRGMRQRLGIADALSRTQGAHLDEPWSPSTPRASPSILALIAGIAASGASPSSSRATSRPGAGGLPPGRHLLRGPAHRRRSGGRAGGTWRRADDVVEVAVEARAIRRLAAERPGCLGGEVDPAAPGRYLVRLPRGNAATLATTLAGAGFAPPHLRSARSASTRSTGAWSTRPRMPPCPPRASGCRRCPMTASARRRPRSRTARRVQSQRPRASRGPLAGRGAAAQPRLVDHRRQGAGRSRRERPLLRAGRRPGRGRRRGDLLDLPGHPRRRPGRDRLPQPLPHPLHRGG